VWQGEWKGIPNTERGSDPSVSPSGDRVAYFEYTDGTMNLVNIKLDGTDKNRLTTFDDGTWFQVVDWSPDSSQLVFSIFRNYQQNLYIANADGSDISPIMVDEWEEMDAHWAEDGKIYFSADPEGVFNIFSYDPSSEDFRQITNVVGAAESPQITPDGNLVYSYYTSFGWKVFALPGDQFMNAPASHLFNTAYDKDAAREALKAREDMSVYEGMTTKYRSHRAMAAPSFSPLYRVDNDSNTSWGMQGGFVTQMMDYVQDHQFSAMVLLGEETILQASYTFDGWYPSLELFGLHYRGRNDQGFLLDSDDDPSTAGDQDVFEVRRDFSYSVASAAASYQWNSRLLTSVSGSGLVHMLRTTDSATYQPFQYWSTVGFDARWSDSGWLARNPSPDHNRAVELSYNHGWADILYE
jgi:hypothetical protein